MEETPDIEMFMGHFFQSWEEVEQNGEAPPWLPDIISEAGDYEGAPTKTRHGSLKEEYVPTVRRKGLKVGFPGDTARTGVSLPGERVPLARDDFYRSHSPAYPRDI